MKIDTTVKLNNGVEMPISGLGTYQLGRGQETQEAVRHALRVGYRLIDSAAFYGNEEDIGRALVESGIPRKDVFITTKLWNTDHGYNAALAAFEKSLKRLGLIFIDLYLIHWPLEGLRKETWKALEYLLQEEKCHAIGVSNYMLGHLQELLNYSSTAPAVNQVEFSPYLYQKGLLEFCRSREIQLVAYSPLTKGRRLRDPKLVKIAASYSKSAPQILIRWALQHELVVIPKSSTPERISENAEVFDFSISSEDMSVLDSFNEDLHTSWDPTTVA